MDSNRPLKTLPQIMGAVCAAAGCDPMAITQPHPKRTNAAYKHVGMFIARQHGYTFEEIAPVFGVNSHASVIYAVNRITAKRKDHFMQEVLERVTRELYGA